jgi:type II secretory pathway component PulF
MNAPDPIAALLFGLFRAALGLAVVAPLLYGFYFLLTLPWRRRERAALLLDLLELGRRDGRTPAETLASLTTIPDRRLPARLHLLAAHLENGLSLEDALDHVPHLLPPGVRGMLQIGLRHGQPDRVFNLCRQALLAPLGPGQSSLIYLSLVFTVVALAGLPSVVLFRVVIEPKLQQIWADLATGTQAEAWLERALSASGWSMGLSLAVTALLYLGLFTHIGGPRA